MFHTQAKTDITKIDPNEPELQLFKAFIPLHIPSQTGGMQMKSSALALRRARTGSLHSSPALTAERTRRLILCDRAAGPIEISCLLTREAELCVAVPARTQSS